MFSSPVQSCVLDWRFSLFLVSKPISYYAMLLVYVEGSAMLCYIALLYSKGSAVMCYIIHANDALSPQDTKKGW